MDDAISRLAVIQIIEKMRARIGHNLERSVGRAMIEILDDVGEDVGKLPSALGTNLAEVGTNCSEFPNNSDAISRQAAIDALRTCYDTETITMDNGDEYINYGDAVGEIEQLPPVQPKRGRWISADAMFHGVPFYCSECGENTRDTVMGKPRWKYCPMCGSRNEVTT